MKKPYQYNRQQAKKEHGVGVKKKLQMNQIILQVKQFKEMEKYIGIYIKKII